MLMKDVNSLILWADVCIHNVPVLMDRAYEGDETRRFVRWMGYEPVVPPKANRLFPWEYDKNVYKRRNEVARLFRRLKGFRRIATRYDKLDIMFLGFIVLSLVVMELKTLESS
jgi:transposase